MWKSTSNSVLSVSEYRLSKENDPTALWNLTILVFNVILKAVGSQTMPQGTWLLRLMCKQYLSETLSIKRIFFFQRLWDLGNYLGERHFRDE